MRHRPQYRLSSRKGTRVLTLAISKSFNKVWERRVFLIADPDPWWLDAFFSMSSKKDMKPRPRPSLSIESNSRFFRFVSILSPIFCSRRSISWSISSISLRFSACQTSSCSNSPFTSFFIFSFLFPSILLFLGFSYLARWSLFGAFYSFIYFGYVRVLSNSFWGIFYLAFWECLFK